MKQEDVFYKNRGEFVREEARPGNMQTLSESGSISVYVHRIMEKIRRGEVLNGAAIPSSLWAPLILGTHWIRGAANTSDNPGFCRNTGGFMESKIIYILVQQFSGWNS